MSGSVGVGDLRSPLDCFSPSQSISNTIISKRLPNILEHFGLALKPMHDVACLLELL